MMRTVFVLQLLLMQHVLFINFATAQTDDDTVRVLDTISIEAFAADRPRHKISASIGIVRAQEFSRFSGTSILPAFNFLPGVRMEERSPGSYRFSIRGSLLRSPFGVRNVKFYWNGLPFTDGGGNTYLNLLDVYSFRDAEVLKGPAGSLYGAGTGGAVLLRSAPPEESAVGISTLVGSYGTYRLGAHVEAKSEHLRSRTQFVHQKSDGFRQQSAMKRSAFHADFDFPIDASNVMRVTILYTDLYYQTPGGLTEAQYKADARQARPSSGAVPGAIEQQAAVFNKTLFSGVHYERQWNASWSSMVGLFASSTEFKNPAIRNYEVRDETNQGARLTTTWEMRQPNRSGKVVFGGEFQQYRSPITVTNNLGGIPGPLVQSQDKITSTLALGFVQGEVELPNGFQVTGGLSINYVELKDERAVPTPAATQNRIFNPVLLPRVALLQEIGPSISVFASASRGFSPPTVAEVMPSTGIYNPLLNPESGWNYEAGVNGKVGSLLEVHASIYDFRLVNAIVLQRDSLGADYYVNAGDTRQQGIEVAASWARKFRGFVESLDVTTAITYSAYTFGTYIKDGSDYSGNSLTGVPPWMIALGIDADFAHHFYARVSANYADRIPLNDANTDYAGDYFLLGFRVGKRFQGQVPFDFFAGVDNLLDQSYSLGNDLNAAGNRYYNAAPRRNFYAGLTARLGFTPR